MAGIMKGMSCIGKRINPLILYDILYHFMTMYTLAMSIRRSRKVCDSSADRSKESRLCAHEARAAAFGESDQAQEGRALQRVRHRLRLAL